MSKQFSFKLPNARSMITNEPHKLSLKINPVIETLIVYYFKSYLEYIVANGGRAFQDLFEMYFKKKDDTLVTDLISYGLVKKQKIGNVCLLSLTQQSLDYFDLQRPNPLKNNEEIIIKTAFRSILQEKFSDYYATKMDFKDNFYSYITPSVIESGLHKMFYAGFNEDGAYSIEGENPFNYKGYHDNNYNFFIEGQDGYYDTGGIYFASNDIKGYYDSEKNFIVGSYNNIDKYNWYDSFGFSHRKIDTFYDIKEDWARKKLEVAGRTKDGYLAIVHYDTDSTFNNKRFKKIINEDLSIVNQPFKLIVMVKSVRWYKVVMPQLRVWKKDAVNPKYMGCLLLKTNAERYTKFNVKSDKSDIDKFGELTDIETIESE